MLSVQSSNGLSREGNRKLQLHQQALQKYFKTSTKKVKEQAILYKALQCYCICSWQTCNQPCAWTFPNTLQKIKHTENPPGPACHQPLFLELQHNFPVSHSSVHATTFCLELLKIMSHPWWGGTHLAAGRWIQLPTPHLEKTSRFGQKVIVLNSLASSWGEKRVRESVSVSAQIRWPCPCNQQWPELLILWPGGSGYKDEKPHSIRPCFWWIKSVGGEGVGESLHVSLHSLIISTYIAILMFPQNNRWCSELQVWKLWDAPAVHRPMLSLTMAKNG